MAMLAQPRQRKQYTLTPRGKALYEDDTRFGTKMLEKMGWSKGKGLGANEDGSQDFVRVRMRNTNEGLGFEDRDDHWTQHENDFNGLLKTLNGDDGKSEKAVEDKESTSDEDIPRVGFGFAPEPKKPKVEKLKDKISGISLEQKSKLSKVRVHYKKFTKGKDIAQYSEKDLANIFGKKVVETEQADGVYAQLTAVMPEENNENFAGVQTISTGLSVSDYFKQKMEALKSKQKQENNSNSHTENKKKSKKRKRERESVEAGSQTVELIPLKDVENNTVLEVQEKNEKHKKRKRTIEEIPTETIENLAIFKNDEKKNTDSAIEFVDLTDEADNENMKVPKNKKKKKKCKENEIEQHTNQNYVIDENKEVDILATEMPKKKKKSKKSKSNQSKEDDDVIIVGYEAPTSSEVPEHTSKSENLTELRTDDHIKVKKNKKSKKRENSEENIEEISTPETSPDSKKSKKQKKSVEMLQASETAEQTTEKSKKSKKDQKNSAMLI
ncbi:PIN2/TERF1-interacting telomerase inhibitor 1 isoform X2 [Bactrocera dorsalis]|uniref:PIN2/TERF1-interacting telomerase inhibitor 1 isoform X2 n=1 Tax=Bactrocera dorsalis TaxID=27457 RepID=A0A6I9VCK9_BACDO|nr:PIN2/TERF1-interacting telomerase inhibitor 1 isoform X2 [Bactrocera dorsalis]